MKDGKDIILTKRELDVMKVLWRSGRGMTASEIGKAAPELKRNTILPVLRKLLKNNIIEVSDIVYSGTVLSRQYKPCISEEEYSVESLTAQYRKLENSVSKVSLVSHLLDSEEDSERLSRDLDELERLVNEYKNKMK